MAWDGGGRGGKETSEGVEEARTREGVEEASEAASAAVEGVAVTRTTEGGDMVSGAAAAARGTCLGLSCGEEVPGVAVSAAGGAGGAAVLHEATGSAAATSSWLRGLAGSLSGSTGGWRFAAGMVGLRGLKASAVAVSCLSTWRGVGGSASVLHRAVGAPAARLLARQYWPVWPVCPQREQRRRVLSVCTKSLSGMAPVPSVTLMKLGRVTSAGREMEMKMMPDPAAVKTESEPRWMRVMRPYCWKCSRMA